LAPILPQTQVFLFALFDPGNGVGHFAIYESNAVQRRLAIEKYTATDPVGLSFREY
jgi:hypothetical protein